MTVQQALSWLRWCTVCLVVLPISHSAQSAATIASQRLAAAAAEQSATSPLHMHTSRSLQQFDSAAISSFLTVGSPSKKDAGLSSPAADLAAVAGTPLEAQSLSPELAADVQQAQQYNLDGEAPGNEEPYAFNLSDPDVLPNANADRRQVGISG